MITWLFSILALAAPATAADMYRVNTGTDTNINAHNSCKNVANASGSDIMVPVKSSAEWTAFKAAVVAGVTVTDCEFCPGVSTIGGTCPNGARYLGTFDYGGSIGIKKLLITPGACTDSATPTCGGGADTVTKRWQESPGSTNTTATSANDGLANTIAAVAAGGPAKSAAAFCDNMTYVGLSDWYLPAPDEWAHVTTNMNAFGGETLFSCQYWTSRQDTASAAHYGGDNSGYCGISTMGKTNNASVRCILRY